mmetsp:Transcript_20825/g.49369  ORF Transcript_20825/g.49369 Transcript_20825/m.49369 type:complete len:112 (+) Transcript_20825:425-760(+)
MLMKSSIDRCLPMRDMLRTEIAEPKVPASKRDNVEPILVRPSTEREALRRAYRLTDTDDPKAMNSRTERDAPMRATDRTEIDSPKVSSLSTDSDEPNREWPNTDRALAMRL